jgi:hypothetical protein
LPQFITINSVFNQEKNTQKTEKALLFFCVRFVFFVDKIPVPTEFMRLSWEAYAKGGQARNA